MLEREETLGSTGRCAAHRGVDRAAATRDLATATTSMRVASAARAPTPSARGARATNGRAARAGPGPGRRAATARATTTLGNYGGFVDGNKLARGLARGDGRRRAATFAERAGGAVDAPRTRGGRATKTMMPIGVPRVPYKTPNENMWQWVDIWNCLYRERIIWIGQTIDEELGNQLVATMLFLDSADRNKPMYLYINSEGGQIVPTMAILDTMKHLNAEVGTVGFGSARAMGGLLLASGAKGKRAALPNTCIMLHHPSGVARGSASDVQNEGKELMRIRGQINKKISDITGRPVEQVSEEIRRDKHFTPEAALDYGIIDKILYRPRAGAR